MDRIISRFPDETLKTYFRFLPATGNLKYPDYPVNPVYIIKI